MQNLEYITKLILTRKNINITKTTQYPFHGPTRPIPSHMHARAHARGQIHTHTHRPKLE